MHRTVRVFALLAAGSALAACATSKYENDPDYDMGFSDGCSTASSRVPGSPPTQATRDDGLWRDSEGYRAGWKAGYGACTPGGRGDTPGGDRDIGGR
jgi:hypothetical protein